jgi:hypothetical protein
LTVLGLFLGVSFAVFFPLLPFFLLTFLIYTFLLLGVLVYHYRTYLSLPKHYPYPNTFSDYLYSAILSLEFSFQYYPVTHVLLVHFFSLIMVSGLMSMDCLPLMLDSFSTVYASPLPIEEYGKTHSPSHSPLKDGFDDDNTDDPDPLSVLNISLSPIPQESSDLNKPDADTDQVIQLDSSAYDIFEVSLDTIQTAEGLYKTFSPLAHSSTSSIPDPTFSYDFHAQK